MKQNEILLIHGKDISAMTIRLAEEANLAELIGDRKKRIGFKPNLVVSRPASGGATTHPEIAEGLIVYLKKQGFGNMVILEGSWTGDSTSRAFVQCGYTRLAKAYDIKLIDTQKDSYRKINCRGMDMEICSSAMELDFLINLPVMKGHCQTRVTCALKNNKGLISDREKRRFHSLGLHKPIAHLNTAIRSDFILADGICGDLDFEEGGNPVYGGRLFAALDPVLCDAWAAAQMGYKVSEIPYIGLAEKLGLGLGDPSKAQVRELSAAKISSNVSTGKVKALEQYIREDQACSACYAALVSALSRMDPSKLRRLGTPVSIGQGFKDKKGVLGSGRCTSEFAHSCPGCPPTDDMILAFLQKLPVTL